MVLSRDSSFCSDDSSDSSVSKIVCISSPPRLNTASLHVHGFVPSSSSSSSSSEIRSTLPVSPSKLDLLSRNAEVEPSLTRDKMFSRGYSCLSQAVYFFDGMKKLDEQNEREIDSRYFADSKELELAKLRKMVDALKGDLEKYEQRAKEKERKAAEKMREVERRLEYAEARATAANAAIANYKNSEELKIEKHKFASKAFAIGFELCKRQVLEIDPGFDIQRIDVKRNEAYSSSSSA